MAEPQQAQVYQFKELEKFQLFTETPGVAGKRSRLGYSSYRGNPRITVFTNVPNDTGKGMINAAMNPETFLTFLDLFEVCAKSETEIKYKIDCYTTQRPIEGQEVSKEKILSSELYFGKDNTGLVWLSVTAPNRPRIKFDMKTSDFHKIYKSDGKALTEAEGSMYQALATITALRAVFLGHMSELRPPYVPKDNMGQGSRAPARAVSPAGFDDITF